jgi:hypothetical protein
MEFATQRSHTLVRHEEREQEEINKRERTGHVRIGPRNTTTRYQAASGEPGQSTVGRVLDPTTVASVAKMQHDPPEDLIHRFLCGLILQLLKYG